MSAPAQIPSAAAPAQAAAPSAFGQAAPAAQPGVLGVFEALLAALVPAAGAVAPAADAMSGGAKPTDATADSKDDATTTTAPSADPNTLMAALAAQGAIPQPITPPNVSTTSAKTAPDPVTGVAGKPTPPAFSFADLEATAAASADAKPTAQTTDSSVAAQTPVAATAISANESPDLPAEILTAGVPAVAGKPPTASAAPARNTAAVKGADAPATRADQPVGQTATSPAPTLAKAEAQAKDDLAAGDDRGAPTAAPLQDASTPAHAADAAVIDAHGAPTPTAQAAANAPPAALQANVSPETVAKLSAQIARKLDQRTTHFDVALDPAGLGRVNVRVDIDSQGALTAALSFDNPQAAADLKQRAGDLREALAQSGFNLADGALSFDLSSQNGSQQGGGASQQFEARAFDGRGFETALSAADEAASAAVAASAYRASASAALDIRI